MLEIVSDAFDSLKAILACGLASRIELDGLLHLAALTLAVTVGYVGLDRVSGVGLSDHEKLGNELCTVEDKVRALLLQYDPVQKDGYIRSPYNFFAVHILLHVAGIDVKHGWFRRPCRAVRRQRHVPFLNYFRRRTDIKMVTGMATFATGTFLISTAATIWEIPYWANETTAGILFFCYLSSLVWVIFTVAASRKLKRLGPVCDELIKQVHEHAKKTFEELIDMQTNFFKVQSSQAVSVAGPAQPAANDAAAQPAANDAAAQPAANDAAAQPGYQWLDG